MEINCILLRFGELFLKGNNRYFFENVLINNIKHALKGFNCKFQKSQGRYYIENFDDYDGVVNALTKVFGLHSLSPAYKIKTDLNLIYDAAVKVAPKEGTFRVSVKRADKKFSLKSTDLAANIGGVLLQHYPLLKVDLHTFSHEINVDIRENGFSYIFYDKIMCAGGLPYGTGGKGMLLLSGGIDSPVAAYLMAKRGVKISAVHFHSFPYTSEAALQKVVDLKRKLEPFVPQMRLFVIPFTQIQQEINKHCPSEFMITLMRRFMMRISERLAKQQGCGALITGESLGQVASQTMQSIHSSNSVATMPVFRPLIGFDKIEIMQIAQKIDTYEISILPHQDCCTVFLPKHPVIHPKMQEVLQFEARLDVENLIKNAIEGLEIK
jgi:thiamine biosynthesis protein ThiI